MKYRTKLQKTIDILTITRDNENCIITKLTRLGHSSHVDTRSVLDPLLKLGFVKEDTNSEDERGTIQVGVGYNLTPGGYALLSDLIKINSLGLKI